MENIFEDAFSKEDEMRELKDENNRLLSLVVEKDLEMKNLTKKYEKDVSFQNIKDLTQDAAAVKIIELSKKIRELNNDLQISQNKTKTLQSKCKEYEAKMSCETDKYDQAVEQGAPGKQKNEIKVLQEKLKQNDFKLTEARTQISSLKSDVKLLNKIISQEVGEGVTIQSILSGDKNTWRGRKEQINALNKKVSDLKKQIEKLHQRLKSGEEAFLNDDEFYKREIHEENKEKQSITLTAARETLKNIEESKKEQIKKLTEQLSSLQSKHSTVAEKHEGLKARNQVLTTESKSLKEQVKMLLQKAKNDEELVEALLKQQNQLRQALIESGKTQQKLSNQNNFNNNSNLELTALRNEITVKDAKLQKVEEQLQKLISQNCDLDLNDSLNSQQNINSGNNNCFRYNEVAALKTLNLTMEYEKNKFKEMLETIDAENKMLITKLAEKESECRLLMKKCGRLEGEVKRLYSGSTNVKKIKKDLDSQVDLETIKLKLETLEDEKKGLKNALDASFKSKKEQVAMVEKMLEYAKNSYITSLKVLNNDNKTKNNDLNDANQKIFGGSGKENPAKAFNDRSYDETQSPS